MKHRYKLFFFLLGQSGSGKDTQAGMLLTWLDSLGIKYLYISIGDEVRGTIAPKSFFRKLLLFLLSLLPGQYFISKMKEINDQGKLQPPVMPLYFFLSKFIPQYTGKELIIVNGSPRSSEELALWESMVKVGYLPPACIIELDVSDEECRKRLKIRGRSDSADDKKLDVKLGWYGPIRQMLTMLPANFRSVRIPGDRHEEVVFDKLCCAVKEELGF